MFRRKLALLLSSNIIFISFCSSLYSGWDANNEVYTKEYKGKIIQKVLNIPHKSQPNTYTCGATNLQSIVRWKTLYNGDNKVVYDIDSIYQYVNTNDSDGIQIPELKSGYTNLIDYTNNIYGMKISNHTTEIQGKTIADAIYGFYNINLLNKNSPAILYGNTKDGLPGYHYYMAIGGINCDKAICGLELKGLYLNDSVYDSPGWTADSSKRKNALTPWQFVNEKELETYWKKTGSKLPWERTHNMLTFP